MKQQPKRVLFVATVVKTHIMTFHLPVLKLFQDMGWETAVAARNDYEDPADCRIPYCDTFFDIPFVRAPYHPRNLLCYRQLKRVIDEGGYSLIHCHTPVGGVLGRLAARKARKNGTRVLYTAHGFHFFQGAPLKNWLLYYPVEKLCAPLADGILTINEEDYRLAEQNLKTGRIFKLSGVGVDVDRLAQAQSKRQALREECGIGADEKIVLSVGELSARKNQKVIIKALTCPGMERVHYVIAGEGALRQELESYAAELRVRDRLHLLGFRSDIAELLKSSDVFAFPSYQEGLPVSVMEAMAVGVPVVASRIRGNVDLIDEEKGGVLFAPTDGDGFARGVVRLLGDPELTARFVEYSSNKIRDYDERVVIDQLREVYTQYETSDFASVQSGHAGSAG